MSARSKIVNKLVDLFNTKLNGIDYPANVFKNTHNKLVFWDEVNNFPFISIVAGEEAREYLPNNFKWAYLEISIRIYVKKEYPQAEIEKFFESIESLLDDNNNLVYDDSNNATELISILSLSTDQGLFSPIGVGEIIIQVQYDL